MVARKLESKIRDHLHGSGTARSSGGPGLFAQAEGSGLGGLSRPGKALIYTLQLCHSRHSVVLILWDRNLDLVPILSHSWTYQALVHDVMDMRLSRVTMSVSRGTPVIDYPVLLLWYSRLRMEAGHRRRPTTLIKRISFGPKTLPTHSPKLRRILMQNLIGMYIHYHEALIPTTISCTSYKQDAAEITRSTGITDVNDVGQM